MGFCLNHKRILLFIMVIIFLAGSVMPVWAENDNEYNISGYYVNANINTDGSVDITESIDYTFYGGFNNIMIPIVKNEGEEIEVNKVYMLRKQGLTECKRLLAGQWDAEVFTGTYSVIDEGDIIKLKLYGSFSKTFGSVIIKYKVKNAVKKYKDIAEYRRMHILKSWETRISNINIYIYFPVSVNKGEILPFLHGVFVGSKDVQNQKTVEYNVPDTVPGEYVEARVLFPEEMLTEYPLTENRTYLEEALGEEAEYQKSDKADLLAARENAARKAGQKAFNDRLRQRAKIAFVVISLLLSLSGIYILILIQRKIRRHKKSHVPESFNNIEKLDPAEVRMLLANGRTGSKALLGNLLVLSSKGYLSIEAANSGRLRFVFRINKQTVPEELNEADRYLLKWAEGQASGEGIFDPAVLLESNKSHEKASELKSIYDQWDLRVREEYDKKNMLDESIIKYRNMGILSGTLLAFLGFVIPVTLAIAEGFLMIPVGLLLLLYSLRIRKHTDYGIYQHRIWMTIKKRIIRNNIAMDLLPEWMKSRMAFLGFSVVLGFKKEMIGFFTNHTETNHHEDCRCSVCSMVRSIKNINGASLYKLVKNTLGLLDEAVSSVQDAV